MKIIYTVLNINGDYAYVVSDSGIYTNIALALLPNDINEGDTILCLNFQYLKL